MNTSRAVVLAVFVGLWGLAFPAAAQNVSLAERFALADDREAVLRELVPGTDDYFYYHCLHYQNTGRLDESAKILESWPPDQNVERRIEIAHRQMLLGYASDREATRDYLTRTLGLRFNHEPERPAEDSGLPTSLDPALIDRARLTEQALARPDAQQTVDPFEPSAYEWLIARPLDPAQRRDLLRRLDRPDYPDLPRVVAEELDSPQSSGFGSLTVHALLTRAQLEELLRHRPRLINELNFIHTYIQKLAPPNHAVIEQDAEAREAYLARLTEFTARLEPAHNSLKAHVLYHRLAHDRDRGVYDKARFLEYLRLPRRSPYLSARHVDRPEFRNAVADVGGDFQAITGLETVHNDEPLIREYLEHFFVNGDSIQPYEEFLDPDYLRRVFAATRLLYGEGDPAPWIGALSPDEYAALRDRVDIAFVPTNPTRFAPDAPVGLDLWIKNVPTLIVRVFEIHAGNYYRRHGREVNTDIDLAGLAPNDEQVHTYDTPPVRRILRHFDFPGLDRRGIYVIDFIGNGVNSRALIRKGHLHYTVRTGAAGHVFTIYNEAGEQMKDGRVWVGGREYTADAQGAVTVPFTAQPGEATAVLSDGELDRLITFNHLGETYRLEAGIHVDRESLVGGETAQVLVRPRLTVNGAPVSLSLLEEPRLVIAAVDGRNVPSRKEVRDFELHEGRESVYEFRVPDDLRSVTFALEGRVRKLTTGDFEAATAADAFTVNTIDGLAHTEALHLGRTPNGYTLDLLGKSGEARPHRPVRLSLKHRDFREPVRTTLQTDESGRIRLGALADITHLTAAGPEGIEQSWPLRDDSANYPNLLTAAEGDVIRLPYMGRETAPQRAEFGLLERRDGAYTADVFDALAIEGGYLAIRDLEPGDYELIDKSRNRRVAIRVSEGLARDGYVLEERGFIQLNSADPVQVTDVSEEDDSVAIRVAHATPQTRVHVVATVFAPTRSIFDDFAKVTGPEPAVRLHGRPDSGYSSGRIIGDEYRYVLERKYGKKYAGVMLERPGLLLNPWALSPTETSTQEPAPELAAQMFGDAPASEPPAVVAPPAEQSTVGGEYPNLDFLPGGGVVFYNLVPDDDGRVRIPRAELRDRRHLHVVAVSPRATVYREFGLDEANPAFRDLRLAQALDPAIHAVEQKRVTPLASGEEWASADSAASFEVYDSVGKVFALYATLLERAGGSLAGFEFLARWPELSEAEKRAKYSEFASHELSFFLFQKDPAFFEAVVKPFIRNKADKQFIDLWLLSEDLEAYLEPWRYEQLTVAERILLARRVADERRRTLEHVRDISELIPPDPDRFEFLFQTALRGGAFDAAPQAGLAFYAAPQALGREGGMLGGGGFGGGGLGGGGLGAGDALGVPVADVAEARAAKAQDFADINGPVMPEDDVRRRRAMRTFYRSPDKTEEFAENNFYRIPLEQQGPALVPTGTFWRDFAEFALGDAPPSENASFLSPAFLEAARTRTEALFALALLELPFDPAEHELRREDDRVVLRAAGPALLVHQETARLEAVADGTSVLVDERFFDPRDRFRFDGNERIDKFVTGEFLVQTVYGGRVVVSNPTSSPLRLDILTQMPQGALPVQGSQYTRTLTARLDPYGTQTFEYFFYFPEPGRFVHYPVQVARNGEVLASGSATELSVVPALTAPDTEAWPYLSQRADNARVLEYLASENLARVDLSAIAWRMKDRSFYDAVLETLRTRRVYDPVLWSYAIHHNDTPAIREFLNRNPEFAALAGPWLDSPILSVDPVERKTYQHLEYAPLVNARVHPLGATRQILNDRFADQYARFMNVLAHKPALDVDDRMEVTYYLLLQDRFDEALSFFQQVDRSALAAQMQYDYFAAYLALAQEDPAAARAAAAPYEDYPVDRWRDLFAEVLRQLREIDDAEAALASSEGDPPSMDRLAAGEPAVDLRVEAMPGGAVPRITIDYRNVSEARVNYYLMDLELLFSRDPFGRQQSDQFAQVRPHHTETVSLPADATAHTFDLPERYRSSNVVVEVVAGGARKTQAYYANNLTVHVIDPYGQVQVTQASTGRPLAKVYVKVFARKSDGGSGFYKDGYTDLRGRFDYAALSTDDLDNVERFAILLMSEEDGAVVREAAPPKR